VLWGLRYPDFTRRARRRFGPTYTVRPGTMEPVVVTTEPEAARLLFTGDPQARRHANDVVRPLIGEGSVLLLGPEAHLGRRRLLLGPFHGERVRGYAALMERLMAAEVGRWRPGETVATLPAAQDVSIEVILRAVLGVSDEETRRGLRRHIDDVLFYPLGARRLAWSSRLPSGAGLPVRLREAAAFAGALPTPAVMTYFPGMKDRSWRNVTTWRWWRHRDRLMTVLDEHIAATRRDPDLADRQDILALLVAARDESGAGLTDDELRDDLVTLIAAGHETTAAAIAWGAVLLAQHPDVRERAVIAAVDDDAAYLGALVKEVLRLRPPIPVAAGRRLDEPVELGAHRIPAGTPVFLDAWGLHHDPERHPDPERFSPERFLDGSAQSSYAWLPFGGGTRRCVGAALAEMEIRIALRTILRTVAIGPVGPRLAPVARRGVVMVPHGGGRIRITGPAGR
jgi:cytochrome P450